MCEKYNLMEVGIAKPIRTIFVPCPTIQRMEDEMKTFLDEEKNASAGE